MSAPKLTTPRSGFGGRGYRIPGRNRVYPGVTTVLKTVNKGDNFHQWIADQTAAKCIMSLSYLQSVTEEVGWSHQRFFWSKTPDMVGTDVREYYLGVRDDAAELGTNIHEFIDSDLDGLSEAPEPQNIEAEEMVDAWRLWLESHDVVVHRSEFTCVNDELGYAGTADADWTITCLHEPDEETGLWCLGDTPGPHRTLVDLKSSRHTWNEHGYQLAALAGCPVIMREVTQGTEGAAKAEKTENYKKVRSWWVEDARPAWTRYALLHIRPDDLDTEGRHIDRFARLVDRTEDMDLYADGFQGAFILSKTQRSLEQRAKARTKETEKQ